MISAQAYADLLKASWILIDIVSKHPQIKFWSPTGEYLQVQLLAEVCNIIIDKMMDLTHHSLDQMLKSELRTIERMGLRKPGLHLIEQADLSIWVEAPAAVVLRPRVHEVTNQGPGSWQAAGQEVYFQRQVSMANLQLPGLLPRLLL